MNKEFVSKHNGDQTNLEFRARWGANVAAIAAAHAKAKQIEDEEEKQEIPEDSEKPQELSLGELNPLIHQVDFSNKPVIESLKKVTLDLISGRGGVIPEKLGTEPVVSSDGKEAKMRFIAKFEVDSLTEEQFQELEALVESTYSYTAVRTRKTVDKKKEIEAEEYPPTDRHQTQNRRTAGWYLGPAPFPTSPLHQGLFVFRDFGELNSKNLLTNKKSKRTEPQDEKFIVEVRDASMYQTDLVEFITQVSSILGTEKSIDHGDLIYEAYYRLIRLGLKDFDPKSIYGMEEAVSEIKRRLINPLASPELSKGINQLPESALLAGVPGTGKTLVAEQLLYEDTGLLIVPITPIDLFTELTTDPEKQTLFKRISTVSRTTGKRVVLHVDDIENITEEESKTKSSLLNLMAGVTDSGFHIIASTNEPEKISNSLLEPQRFGIRIHCGLQNDEARRKIIDIHATRKTVKEKVDLFASDEERDLILDKVAKLTEGFTPRYLAEIATVAKSFLLERVAKEKETHISLTEKDLGDNRFSFEDWARAVTYVARGYDKEGTLKRDKEIKEYIEHMKEVPGFKVVSSEVFDSGWKEVSEKIAAIRNQSQTQS